MKVKFTEGPSALSVNGERVERGEPVEVSKELGEQLLAQGWKKAGGSQKPATEKPTAEAKPADATTPEPGPKEEGK